MEAAKHGHSTIGIPQSVGAEFANADESEGCPHCGGTGKKPKAPPEKHGHPVADWKF